MRSDMWVSPLCGSQSIWALALLGFAGSVDESLWSHLLTARQGLPSDRTQQPQAVTQRLLIGRAPASGLTQPSLILSWDSSWFITANGCNLLTFGEGPAMCHCRSSPMMMRCGFVWRWGPPRSTKCQALPGCLVIFCDARTKKKEQTRKSALQCAPQGLHGLEGFKFDEVLSNLVDDLTRRTEQRHRADDSGCSRPSRKKEPSEPVWSKRRTDMKNDLSSEYKWVK